jgi:acetyl esterase/lipase
MKRPIAMLTAAVNLLASAVSLAQAPPAEPLWPKGAPGARGTQPQDIPSIQLYRAPAEKANGSAIVVCPGGGYGGLAPHEGEPIAKWLNTLGVTAVVLKYRLGSHGYRHPSMMQDAQRAIRTLRHRADELGIDPKRVGILGFSAGGHLASTAATHGDNGNPAAEDPIDRLPSRPDAAILCYPVIQMEGPYVHEGSRRNLLGDNPDPALLKSLSTDQAVTATTSPTFLWYTADDPVRAENSLVYALACIKHKVPVEVHVFEKGRHGLGLATDDAHVGYWSALCASWLRARGFFGPAK